MSVFTRPGEPVFNVPAVLIVLIAIMAVIHVGREVLLTGDQDIELLMRFAFVPARYDPAFLRSGLAAGRGRDQGEQKQTGRVFPACRLRGRLSGWGRRQAPPASEAFRS